ncbi:MAG: histidine phosphatase family protein, partial [Chloroflexi bacterium]|nr:histidine phosphatase family protein [Chloroflexota bacterium]
MRLLLVRHGETDWNAEERYQGTTDVPLSAQGRAQAQALTSRMAGEVLDAIYASDLQRAWQTAEVIAAPHGLPVRPEPRLREIDFGAWEGLTFDEIRQRRPAAKAWPGSLRGLGRCWMTLPGRARTGLFCSWLTVGRSRCCFAWPWVWPHAPAGSSA